jgi:arylsulfatase A-like enzyme
MERYPPESLPLRPNVSVSLKGVADAKAGKAKPLTSEAALRKAMQGYYGAITGIDEQFARLLKALDETGQAEDTIVVFTSDHGDMLGSQGRMMKSVPFEESCRVPFLVRYPHVVKSGGKSDILFASVDIYPTLCGLAGIAVPAHCVGRDLSAVMRGEPVANPPKHVFLMNQQLGAKAAQAEDNRNADAYVEVRHVNQPNYRGIRTDTHTYAVMGNGRWLLYDNRADPYQLKNLVNDPAQRPLMESFDRLIEAWLAESGDPFPYAQGKTRISDFPTMFPAS